MKIYKPLNDYFAMDENVTLRTMLILPENNSNSSGIISDPIAIEKLYEALMNSQIKIEIIALRKESFTNDQH